MYPTVNHLSPRKKVALRASNSAKNKYMYAKYIRYMNLALRAQNFEPARYHVSSRFEISKRVVTFF